MMRIVSITVAGFLLLLIACDEDEPEIVTGPNNDSAAPAVYFSDVVHFDTSGYMAILIDDSWKQGYPLSQYRPEPYLYWEEHFGEPFTDLNDNGVYDPGIDIFDRRTMDLNRDGKYNGPGEGDWAPGIPFDDIDGNGVCRLDTSLFGPGYSLGAPFVDIINNGIYDSLSRKDYHIGRWELRAQSEHSRTYGVGDVDAEFTFTSDSGVSYDMNLRFRWGGDPYDSYVEVTDSGLLFRPKSLYYRFQSSFMLLDTGIIEDGGERIPVVSIWDGEQYGTIAKRVSTFVTLTIRDSVYTDLVEIVAGLPDVTEISWGQREVWDERAIWRFYFSKERGLIRADLARQFERNSTVRLDFTKRYEAMPITMTR